jgi:hypothetical protein
MPSNNNGSSPYSRPRWSYVHHIIEQNGVTNTSTDPRHFCRCFKQSREIKMLLMTSLDFGEQVLVLMAGQLTAADL